MGCNIKKASNLTCAMFCKHIFIFGGCFVWENQSPTNIEEFSLSSRTLLNELTSAYTAAWPRVAS